MAAITADGSEVAATAVEGCPQGPFDDLVSHREGVFRICLGFARDYAEAEDLTQDVYLKAYRSLAGMRNPLASREWLFRIAKNACLDRDKRTRGRTRLLRHWAATPRPDDGPGPSAPDDERIARVKAAVRGLPKKLRTVFVLRWYGGLSYEEIAVTLGLARGTVMSRLSRARARVAGMVEEK